MRRRTRAGERRHEPFDLPGLTPVEAAWALVEASALTWAELLALRAAAVAEQPEDSPLPDLPPERAAALLARWSGPIKGLRLRPLRHWGTARVRGGAPYDPEARRRAGLDQNPFASSIEEIA